MLAAIFLASRWHFLANKHAVLAGCSAFWPVNCIFLHKKNADTLHRWVALLLLIFILWLRFCKEDWVWLNRWGSGVGSGVGVWGRVLGWGSGVGFWGGGLGRLCPPPPPGSWHLYPISVVETQCVKAVRDTINWLKMANALFFLCCQTNSSHSFS
jgi:hypothetical protein